MNISILLDHFAIKINGVDKCFNRFHGGSEPTILIHGWKLLPSYCKIGGLAGEAYLIHLLYRANIF